MQVKVNQVVKKVLKSDRNHCGLVCWSPPSGGKDGESGLDPGGL